ncbi:MAG: methyltransferase type 12 [Rhodobacteraceae bacterium]|nr:methyltransferase type 12 [Paracoccaceae bacterium]
MPSSDLGLFLRQLLRDPTAISAMAPSSKGLARAITSALSPATGPVAEFGPGTGVFTRAILDRGVAPADLTLFELNPAFCTSLRQQFPGVRVINAGAQSVGDHCQGLGAIISGLPLLSFPADLCAAIFASAVQALRADGAIHQFTYGPKPPLPEHIRADLGLTVTPGPRIWLNLPPARVYTYRRG